MSANPAHAQFKVKTLRNVSQRKVDAMLRRGWRIESYQHAWLTTRYTSVTLVGWVIR